MTSHLMVASNELPAASSSLAIVVNEALIVRDDFKLRCNEWTLPAGVVAALVGANGAGKTTFLSAIAGSLPLKGGTMKSFGVNANDLGCRRCEVIGFVPDQLPAFPEYTVRQHLRMRESFLKSWDSAYAAELVERLDVPMDKAIQKLSHGTKSKVAFISEEAARPPVLLLDEPTAGLDPDVRSRLLQIMRDLVRDQPHRSILLSTHLLEDIALIANSVALVRQGVVSAPIGEDQLHDWRVAPSEERYEKLAELFGVTSFS
jgi:ABC-2 type transport system ATP-binding protein